jgi:alkaline phosphatase
MGNTHMKIFYILLLQLISTSLAFAQSPENGFTTAPPKNIIVMISDGCGYNHVDAASLYQQGKTGTQSYESFPVRLGMATYTFFGNYDPQSAFRYFTYVDEGATDSAAAATAMATGKKTYSGAIGVDVDYAPLKNISEAAEQRGMSTGVVTTVQFSHATPAGFVAHNQSRDNQVEIANEMIYDSALDVIMGCGAPDYDNSGHKAISPISSEEVGGDSTFQDLIDDYRVQGSDANGDGAPDTWIVIRTREEFQALAHGKTPSRVIGLPMVNETLQQKREGDGSAAPYAVPRLETVPTLAEMSRAAVNILDNDKDGFFLMIEAGAVDWASHDNQSGRMIEEEIDFNMAVEAIVSWIESRSSWDETLLIVTGDHECGFLNGPGSNLEWTPLVNNGKGVLPGLRWHTDEHSNQLIPFYAKGRGSVLFRDHIIGTDPVRGPFIDNTAVGTVLFSIFSPDSPNINRNKTLN